MNVIIVLGLFAMLVSVEALYAQEGPRPARPGAPATSCNEFLPPPTRVADKRIGREDCRIVSEETVFNLNGQRFRRRELRISGTAEGWAARQGPRSNYFSDGPDFVFTRSTTRPRASKQSAATAPRPGMARPCSFRKTPRIGTASSS